MSARSAALAPPRLPGDLARELLEFATAADVDAWIHEADAEVGGLAWFPVGGIDNNVHTVEVASDPALALVERPTNSIDALLDLRAQERGEAAPSPHEGARAWWGVPSEGLSAMSEAERRRLADLIRVTMMESGISDRPTVVIQDQGTGQHPEDFAETLLSLLASNKKGAMHLMGVYNAGGAASYKFAERTIVVSRLAPGLLGGRPDEIGATIVRYNPLDPDRFKSGRYEYLAASDGTILRLDLPEMPGLPYGTYVALVEYLIPRFARAAHEPKRSLWHLLHSTLPEPALPLRIIETRDDRFPGVRGVERRVVAGLIHLLGRSDTADYTDDRRVELGPDLGAIRLRYFVLNEGADPDAYTTADQGLTIALNGQRQLTRPRLWLRNQLQLYYLYKRLVVIVDANELTNAARREIFSSTRESGVDTPVAKRILDRVIQELSEDEELLDLDELARERALQDATKASSEKIKRRLASQIGAYIKGSLAAGGKGGTGRKPRRRPPGPPGQRRSTDDTLLSEIPDKLAILTDPLIIQRGGTKPLRLEINAKNGFLPRHAGGLSVVFGPELTGKVSVSAKGRLLGGQVRITIEAAEGAPIGQATLRVALVVPVSGVALFADGTVKIVDPAQPTPDPKGPSGGEPDIEALWYGRDKWAEFGWDAETIGDCYLYRSDPGQPKVITKVEYRLNEVFGPYEQLVTEKRLAGDFLVTFRERLEFPLLFGLFKQRLAEEVKEQESDEEGRPYDIPDDYVRGERARLARGILMAMEPDLALVEPGELGAVSAQVENA